MQKPSSDKTTALRAVPRGVWVLGFVSLLMDVSSEMIHALLPVFLVSVHGASMMTIGLIEGVAEATASITKIFSGALSDWFGKRKGLAALGYGLAAATKPLFPLAASVEWIFAARFIDRIGKGIRGAPRDAMVADLSPPEVRGASFGLRQSLDTVGAFTGPLAAILLMWIFANDITTVFWFAAIPAFLSFGLILWGISEPDRPPGERRVRFPLHRDEVVRLARPYWIVVAIAFVFTLARFSEAFLVLKAQGKGLSLALVPGVLVVMNVAYAGAAYPAGILSDKGDRLSLLLVGIGVLIVADLVLAWAPGLVGVGLGTALWGLHMGLTQGLISALVADTAPADLRGTAFGLLNLVSGVGLLLASLIAGLLWDYAGPSVMFLTGAGFSALAALGLAAIRGSFRGAAIR